MGYACTVAEGGIVTTIIYTKPGCPYCATAKQELEARGVSYDEIDVYTSPGAREQLAEITGGMNVVPVIIEEDGEVRIAAGGG
jgi:glutaredoxin